MNGNGTVYSFTVVSHPVHPALKGHPPYNVVVVLMDGTSDVRLVSNLVNVPADQLRIGMPVSVYWDAIGDGMFLPRFSGRDSPAAGCTQ